MNETVWHERLKLSCKIQPLKNSRGKSTVWRREHYLINLQKYFHIVRGAQPTEWSITHASASPASLETAFAHNHQHTVHLLAAILPNIFRFKKFFFTGRLSNKLVRIWVLKILSNFKCVSTQPCDLSLITTLVWECHLFLDIDLLQGSVATRIRFDGTINNSFTIRYEMLF